MKRTFAVVALWLLVTTIAFAAGQSEGTAGSEVPEVLSFTVYQPNFGEKPAGTPVQEQWLENMESYLGVKLDITWEDDLPFGDYLERQQVYIADGDFADVFHISDLDLVNQLGEDDLVLNLYDYREHMPYYTKFLEAGWNRHMVEAPDGNLYGFSFGSTRDKPPVQRGMRWLMRFDILKQHGLTPPRTLDELYTVAKALKQLYPDSYPINGTGNWLVTTFLNLNQTDFTYYYNGSKYVLAPVDEEGRYRATIEYLNRLYREGLLDPEYVVQSGADLVRKGLTGKHFVDTTNYGQGRVQQYNNNEEYPEVEFGYINVLKGLDGTQGWAWSYGNDAGKKDLLRGAYFVEINSRVEHPELFVKMVDYQYSPEMIDLVSWGIEGLTYTVNADGTKQWLPEIARTAAEKGRAAALAEYGVWYSISCRPGFVMHSVNGEASGALSPELPVYGNGSYFTEKQSKIELEGPWPAAVHPKTMAPPAKLNIDEQSRRTDIMTPIETYIEENVHRFISGDKPFAEWDAFVEKLEGMGDWQSILDLMSERVNAIRREIGEL